MIRFINSSFSSAHFYKVDSWSEAKNRETFGACFDPYGHGHNYRAEFGFEDLSESEVPNATDKVASLIKTLDHHHLNHQIPEFKTKVPTTENIAIYLGEKIQTLLPELKLKKIRVWEMDDIWAEVHFE